MKLILDSNAYTQLEGGNPEVTHLVREAEEILFSSVVAGELLAGFRNGTRFAQNLNKLEAFLRRPRVSPLPVTWDTADRYGRIHTALRRKGRPIPSNDVWIAAHTMETGAYLVSFDAHFDDVDGLAWFHIGKTA